MSAYPDDWSRPALNHCITIPHWLGGARTASYIVLHAWTRWLILLPIIKWKEWRSSSGSEKHS